MPENTPKDSPPAKPSAGYVEIPIDEGKIREAAYFLSQEKRSYLDFIWMLAEADLKIARAFADGSNPLAGALPKVVTILPSRIIEAPFQSEIKQVAEKLSMMGTKVQDLHWFIAIRNYILQEAKKQRK